MTPAKVAERLRTLGRLEKNLPALIAALERHAKEASPVLMPRVRQERDERAQDVIEALEQLKETRRLVERNATLEAQVERLKGEATLADRPDLFKEAQITLRTIRKATRATNGEDESTAQYNRLSTRWLRSRIIHMVRTSLGEKEAEKLRKADPVPQAESQQGDAGDG